MNPIKVDINDLDKYFVKSELTPAIAFDVDTKTVLMLAYMNKESLKKTLETAPAALAAEQSASPRPKHHRLGKALVVLLLLALAALAAGWYYTGGDLAALPQKLQSLGAESLPHAGARLV